MPPRRVPLLWLLALLAIFAGGTLLLALLWMPIWLSPFTWTLTRTAPAGLVLALIPLTYGRRREGAAGRLNRASRALLSPPNAVAVSLGSLLIAAAVAGAQVLLIRRNPHLTLAQYLREEIWVVWLLMLPAAALILGGHALWVGLRAAGGRPDAPPPPEAAPGGD